MGKVEISYEEVEGCTPEEVRQGEIDELKGFQEIRCHIVLDVKWISLARRSMSQMDP